MSIRTCIHAALAVATLAGCATTYDPDAPTYQSARYRTGSNIAVQKGDMHGNELTYKVDDVPLYRPQYQQPANGKVPTP
jgi:hypothetical protein